MDFLIKNNPLALDKLPIEKRAEIQGGLPDELCIMAIAKLSTADKEMQRATIDALIGLCKKGLLKFYGDIDGWVYQAWPGGDDNPFSRAKGELSIGQDLDQYMSRHFNLTAMPYHCLIHRDEFKRYLQSVNQWPVDGLLANWWIDRQVDNTTKQHRKQIIPMQRETSEGLLLIYELIGEYKVNYLDELTAIKAWSLIVSRSFNCDLIKSISKNKAHPVITLNCGDTLTKEEFTDKYRKRFK